WALLLPVSMTSACTGNSGAISSNNVFIEPSGTETMTRSASASASRSEARRSMAFTPCARRRLSPEASYPTICVCGRAALSASPIEAPIRPVPRIATWSCATGEYSKEAVDDHATAIQEAIEERPRPRKKQEGEQDERAIALQ